MSRTRAAGTSVVTGAADVDPAAVGTYAAAGAAFGPSILWIAPAVYPMMFAVVYLSSKLGQVTGQGLFEVVREHFPRWVLYPVLVLVLAGNVIEAGADLGGMAAALAAILPVPHGATVAAIALASLAMQIWLPYRVIRDVFRWLALALLAYVVAALLARPDLRDVVAGTLVPRVRLDAGFLAIVVAIAGTSLSAYLYTWQSTVEVEEEIAAGRVSLDERRGATEGELRRSRTDVLLGMLAADVVMYFVILCTASTLFRAGQHEIATAAEAAEALRPLAGDAAGVLFALGIVGVGCLALPVMTTGAAYDLAQALGWRYGLGTRPAEARRFYSAIVAVMALAVAMNFLGLNAMRTLVHAGIVQGLSSAPLMLLLMIVTNRRSVLGDRVNGRAMNALGAATTVALFAAGIGLILTWSR